MITSSCHSMILYPASETDTGHNEEINQSTLFTERIYKICVKNINLQL